MTLSKYKYHFKKFLYTIDNNDRALIRFVEHDKITRNNKDFIAMILYF